MKKILVCLAAVFAIGAMACGKSAAVSVCEKTNSCSGTTIDCNASSSSNSSSSSESTKCTSEADAYVSCLDSKGTCENKVYSAGANCATEAAAILKCAMGG